MRRTLTITGIATAGLTVAALLAAPAMAAGTAAFGSGTCPITDTTTGLGMNGTGTPGTGQGYGRGNGMGRGGMNGRGSGMAGQGLTTAASGTLTSAQKSALSAMAEEEKMAHDVYVALAARFPEIYQFSRIQNAEAMHESAVQTLLARYGIADPNAGLAEGEFRSPAFQALYDDLLAGATTSAKALAAGITVEKRDIADLTATMTGVTAPDVLQLYTNLRNASLKHLAAFGG